MPKRILEGKVVSDKMDKTVTVLVERRYMHPVYKKYVKRTDKYAAHDENNAIKEGQVVQIQECKPISKRKTWTVITGGAAVEPTKKETKPAAKKETKPKTEAKKAAPKKETKKAAPKKTAAKKETKPKAKKETKEKKA